MPDERQKSILRRRTGTILCIVSLPILAFLFRDQPTTRWGIARSLDYFHSNVDLFSETHNIRFGPFSKTDLNLSLLDNFQNKSNNGPVSTKMGNEFGHEWLGSAKVQEFKASLPFQINKETSVFDLSEKVRQLTEHGREELQDTKTDPLQYLEFAKKHRHLTCRYFSVIYGATARTLGYTTRMLSLSKNGIARDHAVCEVYVPEFSKWVLIDPDFNIAYQKKGEWLNAAELIQEWNKVRSLKVISRTQNKRKQFINRIKNITQIEVVVLGPASSKLRQTNMFDGSQTGINLEFFEYVLYSNRNDYLSAKYPIGHPVRTREFLLRSDPSLPIPQICPEAIVISEPSILYWPVGRTRVELVAIETDPHMIAKLQLSTWTPNFQAFEYQVNGNDWNLTKSNRIKWKLSPNLNKIKVRSINTAGLRGEICSISIEPKTNAPSRQQEVKATEFFPYRQSRTVNVSWKSLTTTI